MPGVQIKICGVANHDDLAVLDEARIDYAGVWFGIRGSARSLDRRAFHALAARPTSHVRCVAVTTQSDPDQVADFVAGCRLSALQLHGFMLPGAIRKLRSLISEDVEIFQVLHVRDDTCLEAALLPQYLCPGGADAFVVDRFVARDRIGSSGERVPSTALERVVDTVGAGRVLVAGGLDEPAIRDMRSRLAMRSVDVDSAARNGDARQRVSPLRIRELAAAAHGALS